MPILLISTDDFDAGSFFNGLYLAGVSPRCDATSISLGHGPHIDRERAESLYAWASEFDPNRSIQIAYAKDAWASRAEGALCVYLG